MSYSLTAPRSLVTPHPSAVYPFFDKIGVWVQEPLDLDERNAVRRHCLLKRKLYSDLRPAGFDPRWRQRLEIYQPTPKAVQTLLSLRRRHYFNYFEPALDWIYDDSWDRDQARAALNHYFVKRYRRRDYDPPRDYGTYYSGPRKTATNPVIYSDRVCKLTGELFCVHMDWRMRGKANLENAGIHSLEDLLQFDHRAFWQARLLLLAVDDLRRLGRIHNNHFCGTRRRRDWIEFYGSLYWDMDAWLGRILHTLFDTQQLLDRFGTKFAVRKCLVAVDASHLLPAQSDRLGLL